MNKSKTKMMMENDTPIYVNNTQFENVESDICPAQRYTTRDKHQDKEIHKNITAGWTAFFKGNIGTCFKRQVYNSCVLSAMTYSAETRTLITLSKSRLEAAQTKMERSLLSIPSLFGRLMLVY